MTSINDSHQAIKPQLLPVFSLLLAATLWGVFWYPLRLLEEQGLHGLWATFFIYSGTSGVMLYILRGRYAEFKLQPWLLMGIALASGWCNTAFILAILEGNVVRVLLLFYLSPLWATLIGWLILKEQLHSYSVIVLIVAMAGALVMLWQPELGVPMPKSASDWMALSSGFSFALVNSLVRSAHRISIQVKTACSWLGVIVFSASLLLVTTTSLATASTAGIAGAILLGAIVMVVMTASVVYGVTHMPVHRSAIILLFELVAGAVSAQWLTEEVVLLREWIGGLLVITAAVLSARRQYTNQGTNIC